MRVPARKVLEDRAAAQQLRGSRVNNASSGEIRAPIELILDLSHQVTQIAGEVPATKNELTATRNELIADKSEMEALKTELAAMIQTQLYNIQVPAPASPPYATTARTPPDSLRLRHRS